MKRVLLLLALVAAPATASPCLGIFDPDAAIACLEAEAFAPLPSLRDLPSRRSDVDMPVRTDRLMERVVRGTNQVCTYTRGQVVVLPLYQRCPSELGY
jgi:hypothetical protein